VAEVSPKVYELSEFLVDVLGVTDVGASFPHRVNLPPDLPLAPPCSAWATARRRLLEAVRGLTLVDLPAARGVLRLRRHLRGQETPMSPWRWGADKARHVRETSAEVLVAGDNSCLMHIGGVLSRQRSGVRVMHLAEILASTDSSVSSRETCRGPRQ